MTVRTKKNHLPDLNYFVRTKVDTGNGIATVYRLKYLTVGKTVCIQRGIATVYRLKLFNCAKDCMRKFSSS